MVGVLLGMVIGYLIPFGINKLTHSLYKRDNVDKIMKDLLGDSYFHDAIIDELMVVAYDYNSQ